MSLVSTLGFFAAGVVSSTFKGTFLLSDTYIIELITATESRCRVRVSKGFPEVQMIWRFFETGEASDVIIQQTGDREWGGGVLNNLACHSHMTIDLASLQSRDGARRVFAGPGSQSTTKREAP